MTEHLRATFDTNIFMSAFLSHNPTSPTKELLQRWENDEFTLLMCDGLMEEIVEKFLERHISQDKMMGLLTILGQLSVWVDVPPEAIIPVMIDDPDDDLILACAVVGQADYLVTYDAHFDIFQGEYQGIKITKALPFLWAVRGDLPHD